MATSSTTAVQGQSSTLSSTSTSSNNRMNDLDADAFLKMLLAELQNQDPLEPLDSQQIVQQIAQIRAVESNTKLTATLQSVLLGQNVATAGNLLGKTIQGQTDGGTAVSGRVDRVAINDGVPVLYVGEQAVSLSNVSDIQSDSAE